MTGPRHAPGLFGCFLLLLVAADCLAQPAPSGLLYSAPPNGVYVAIAAGAAGVITIEVRNPQTLEVPAGTLYGAGLWQSDTGYTMTPVGALPCAPPVLPPTALGRFTIARPAMPPGGLLRCEYRLQRAPSAPSVRSVHFGELCSVGGGAAFLCGGPSYYTGTLGDVGIRAEIVGAIAPGATSAVARFTLSNDSAIAIASSAFGTCSEYGNTLGFASDVADACTLDLSVAPPCFLDRAGWRVGPIPAYGTRQCNLRVVFDAPLTSPRSALLVWSRWRYEGDLTAWDTNPANDSVTLRVAPGGPLAVPLGTWTNALLVFALALTAILSLAQARTLRRTATRHDSSGL